MTIIEATQSAAAPHPGTGSTPADAAASTPAPHPMAPDRERLLALSDSLAAAAGDLLASDAPAAVSAGCRRRADKLARQLLAESRLLRRGSHLSAPANIDRLERLARFAAADPTSVAGVDARIAAHRQLLRGLHEWRGHKACLLAAKR